MDYVEMLLSSLKYIQYESVRKSGLTALIQCFDLDSCYDSFRYYSTTALGRVRDHGPSQVLCFVSGHGKFWLCVPVDLRKMLKYVHD